MANKTPSEGSEKEDFGLEGDSKRSLTRREFLKGVAAGAAGGVIVSGGGYVIWKELQPEDVPEDIKKTRTGVPISDYIRWDADKCIGCERCMLGCAVAHGGKIGPQFSGVMWESDFLYGYNRTPLFCNQCDAPDCYEACPVEGALVIDEKTGARYINRDKCIGCRRCIEACTYTPPRINFDQENLVAIKCDLCSGREGGPACIQVCSEAGGGRALSYISREEV